MNSSTSHRPAAARTSRQGSHQTVGGVQLRRAPVHAGRAYPDLLSLGRASSVHRQDLLRCLSASGLAGLPMSDRSEPRPEALPRESSGHGAASSSIEARREGRAMSSRADRVHKGCSVRFCYIPLGLFGTEVHAEVRPPWVALSKGLRLPLLRKHGRLRQNNGRRFKSHSVQLALRFRYTLI